MVIEQEQVDLMLMPLFEWLFGSSGWGLQGSLGAWLKLCGILVGAAVIVGWFVAALRTGPVTATVRTGRTLVAGLGDLFLMSPRRVLALTGLAVKESIRRRIIVVFCVFAIVLLLAGWFLDPGATHPAVLYLNFVLSVVTYLVLLLALFLSALSLPGEIQNKTIHTVVTKPVRQSEIVLGRILGFTAVGTVLLLVMGTISWLFVVRGLDHTHELEPSDVQQVVLALDRHLAAMSDGARNAGPLEPIELLTTMEHGHRHRVRINVADLLAARESGLQGPAGNDKSKNLSGRIRSETLGDHWHVVSYDISLGDPASQDASGQRGAGKSGTTMTASCGKPLGRLVARVPMYSDKLSWQDDQGRPDEKGVNTGDEWMYRGFIQGGGPAAAIWTFENLTEEEFPNGLPVEMTLEVFRTTKGDTESDEKDIRGLLGLLSVRNPETGTRVDAVTFTAKDFTTLELQIPRKLQPAEAGQEELDLFDDLVHDGKLEVWLQGLNIAQYFGVARADLYLRAREASFTVNLLKGYIGIWLQMMLVIAIGVMFSTFLSGPVAAIGTLGVLVGGLFRKFMTDLGEAEVVGGGPAESFYRLITQRNVVSELEPGLMTQTIEMFDNVFEGFLALASSILPNFREYAYSDYVAYGFDIAPNVLFRCLFEAFAYLLPIFIAGYFFLKTREVAK